MQLKIKKNEFYLLNGPATLGVSGGSIEIIAAKERYGTAAEPGFEDRQCNNRQIAAKGDDVCVILSIGRACKQVVEAVQVVGMAFAHRGDYLVAVLSLDDSCFCRRAREKYEIDRQTRFSQVVYNAVAGLRHAAPPGRVILSEPENAHQLSNPSASAFGSSSKSSADSLSKTLTS